MGGSFPSPSVEDGLDLSAQRDARIDEVLNRTMQVPKTDAITGSSLEIPIDSLRASKSFQFDSSGNPVMITPTDASGTTVTATGSTTGRTLAERFSDVINVKDYGATGDGTTDDTTEIQAALDKASSGGTVFFPVGDYLISASLNVKSDTTLRGEGYGSKIICPDAGWVLVAFINMGLINIDTKSNVEVTGLRLYGTKTQDIDNTPKLIFMRDTANIFIHHNSFENSAFEALWEAGTIADTKYINVSNNYFNNVGHPADAFVGLPAIQMNAVDVVIANNILINVGTGIGASGDRTLVEGNFINGITNVGIGTGDGGTSNNQSIIGNTIIFDSDATTGRVGILPAANAGNQSLINITGNMIRINGTIGHSKPTAIRSNTALHIHIASNTIEIDVFGDGIRFFGVAAGVTASVIGNTVRVLNEGSAAAILAFLGESNGAGKTLTVFSANNRVYGLTVANSAFAYDYRNTSGGTINAYLNNDFTDEGQIRVDDATYSTALHNVPINLTTNLTSFSSFHQSPKIGMLNMQSYRDFGIVDGAITLIGTSAGLVQRRTRITIDTQSGAGTDELDTITGGIDGDILIIKSAASGRDPTLKDGVDNLVLAGDFTLSDVADRIMLESDGTNWTELSRSDNA